MLNSEYFDGPFYALSSVRLKIIKQNCHKEIRFRAQLCAKGQSGGVWATFQRGLRNQCVKKTGHMQ